MAQPLKAELGFREGTSDKVYKLELLPAGGADPKAIPAGARGLLYQVHFLYGRRGAALKGGLKTSRPIGYDACRAVFFGLLREKLNKGYRFNSATGEDAELMNMRAAYSPALDGAVARAREVRPEPVRYLDGVKVQVRLQPAGTRPAPPPVMRRAPAPPPPAPRVDAAPGFASVKRRIRLED